MPRYLAELYLSHAEPSRLHDTVERARAAADELNREGTAIRYLRALFLGEDETCFHLYEAASLEAVREATRRAQLPIERVVETVDIEPDDFEEDKT